MKYGSRKFIALMIQVALTLILPFVYHYVQMSEQVLIMVLCSINGAVAVYTGANLLSKKYGYK